MIQTIRVTSGQEKILAEILTKKAKAENLEIYSIVHSENVKGYLFVEVPDENTLVKLIPISLHPLHDVHAVHEISLEFLGTTMLGVKRF